MSLQRLRQSRIRHTAAFWLIPLVLLSLGLRLCLHAPDTAYSGAAQAAAVHLESGLVSSPDLDDVRNGHVSPAFVPFKVDNPADVFVLAAVLTATLLFFLVSVAAWVLAPPETIPALSGGHRFRPPLRAPPR